MPCMTFADAVLPDEVACWAGSFAACHAQVIAGIVVTLILWIEHEQSMLAQRTLVVGILAFLDNDTIRHTQALKFFHCDAELRSAFAWDVERELRLHDHQLSLRLSSLASGS